MNLYTILFEIRGKFKDRRTKEWIRQYVKQQGYDIPEYILKDYIRQISLEGRVNDSPKEIQAYLDWLGAIKNWKLEGCLTLSFGDLTNVTQGIMIDRKFGSINPYKIFDDEARMAYQQKALVGDCSNEPVFFTLTPDGYELQEGWHRTMTLFSRLPFENGEPQGTIKVKAWVGKET